MERLSALLTPEKTQFFLNVCLSINLQPIYKMNKPQVNSSLEVKSLNQRFSRYSVVIYSMNRVASEALNQFHSVCKLNVNKGKSSASTRSRVQCVFVCSRLNIKQVCCECLVLQWRAVSGVRNVTHSFKFIHPSVKICRFHLISADKHFSTRPETAYRQPANPVCIFLQ